MQDIPIVADSTEQVVALCQQLENGTSLKKEGRCKKLSLTVTNTTQTIDSWKFNEWDYGKPHKVTLPINARGLFTINKDKIVVRGYDKFFNVGEVESTQREHMKVHTKGPYDVTLKENGCIILIGGLSTGEIVVCSKHSTGERAELTTNHALEGEAQLAAQLAKIGKTTHELATYLHKHNLTAIAELCDDSFEEHVLEYTKEQSGLYLHGLNYNTIEFATVPIDSVTSFATEWGFKTIKTIRYEDYDELFKFLDECTKTGTYHGREVEGFVIRSKIEDNKDFFFKFKFEQPYLLYRNFREVTKTLVAGKPIKEMRLKKNKYITEKYLLFVEQLFAEQPQLKESFKKGHAIIKVRKLFLEHINEKQGINLLNIDSLHEGMENLKVSENAGDSTKYIIIPVATIACGKTTVFQTLINLFPDWSHVQNDNISKGSKLKLVDQCIRQLQIKQVVLVDRNNSEYRERRQLFQDFDVKRENYIDENVEFKYICLNFIDENLSQDDLWDITFNRIKRRGDNHQSIKSATDEKLAINIMKGFIKRFQPVNSKKLPDSAFDKVINLKLIEGDSSLENVKTIIDQIKSTFPQLISNVPSDAEIDTAFQAALDYKPSFVKVMTSKPKVKQPGFFGVGVGPSELNEKINSQLKGNQDWEKLQEIERVQPEFHVTLGHINSSRESPEQKLKWKQLMEKLPSKPGDTEKQLLQAFADVLLKRIVINVDKLICLEVELLKVYNDKQEEIELEPLNKYLHITVGTFSEDIKAYMSNIALTKLRGSMEGEPSAGEYFVDGDFFNVVPFPRDLVFKNQQIFAFYG